MVLLVTISKSCSILKIISQSRPQFAWFIPGGADLQSIPAASRGDSHIGSCPCAASAAQLAVPVMAWMSVEGPKTWILGEPVLRKYYSAYDWKNQPSP